MPDGTSRFSYNGKPICTTTWALAPSASTPSCRKSRSRRSTRRRNARKSLPARLRRHHRPRRRAQHAKVQPGDTVAVFGLGGIGLAVIQGAAKAEGRPHHRHRYQSRRSSNWRSAMGATDCVNPKDYDKPDPAGDRRDDRLAAWIIRFECIGNVNVMRAALECCHSGWGESMIIGVAGAGQEISHAAVPARHRARVARHGVRRRQGPHAVAGHGASRRCAARSSSLRSSRTRCRSTSINEAFDLMHEGKSIRTVDSLLTMIALHRTLVVQKNGGPRRKRARPSTTRSRLIRTNAACRSVVGLRRRRRRRKAIADHRVHAIRCPQIVAGNIDIGALRQQIVQPAAIPDSSDCLRNACTDSRRRAPSAGVKLHDAPPSPPAYARLAQALDRRVGEVARKRQVPNE